MIERAFQYLFLLAIFAPPIAVVAGVLLLFAGSRRSQRVPSAQHTAGT